MDALELIGTVIAAAGGSAVVIGGVAAWVGTLLARRIADYRELEFSIDLDLRKRRLPVYQELWAATDVLPKWPRNSDATYGDLGGLSETLRDWYFHQGGHLLSERTHLEAYSPLQDSLTELAGGRPDEKLSDGDYDRIRAGCSTLRSHLAADLQSRRESPLA